MIEKKISSLRKILKFLSLFIILILFQANTDGKDANMPKNINELWKNVETFESNGLPKSALEIVDMIYKKSKDSNDNSNLIKSIIYKIKFDSQIKEDSSLKSIEFLKDEIKVSKNPVKSVLRSILADLYWQYYLYNRYIFQNRSSTTNFENNDISTWDLRKLVEEISREYLSSIEDADELKKYPIKNFDEILTKGNSDKLRPTLYDFLSHRALAFFMNEESNLVEPVYKFEINNKSFFSGYNEFYKMKLETKDNSSLKYNAMLILQKLIEFHAGDEKKDALLDVDLIRLNFVYRNAVLEDKNKIYLSELENLEKKHSQNDLQANISYNKALYYYNLNDRVKAYEICNDAVNKYPDSEGGINSDSLKSSITSKEVSFLTEKINIPDKPVLGLVNYRNLDKLYFRIYKITDENKSTLDEIVYNKTQKEQIKYLLSLEKIKGFEIELPKTDDFQNHSAEIKIPELQNGYYAIVASYDKDFSLNENAISYSLSWVSNLSCLNYFYNNSYIFYIIDRESGNPIKDVTINTYKKEWNDKARKYYFKKQGTSISDINGKAEIKSSSTNQFYIELIYKDEKIMSDRSYYNYSYNTGDYTGTIQTIFFTDRAIYRPGQTIYFKGIVFKNSDQYGTKKDILKNYKSKVYYQDVNGQTISEIDVTTNEFGSFNGSFSAPVDRLNGQMLITDNNGQVSFSVEEYKRPKFEIGFEPLKETYQLFDTLKVKGNAKSYAGANIDDAKVKYRVTRETYFPYYRWFYYYYPRLQSMEITNGETKTNENGEFEISFQALPDNSVQKKDKPVFYYHVSVDVTDSNGETISNSYTLAAGYVNLLVTMNINDIINKEEKNFLTINSTNLSGVFEKAEGVIKITKLKTPDKVFKKRLWNKPDKFIYSKDAFYKSFPLNAYNDEDQPENWEKEKIILEKKFNTAVDKKLELDDLSRAQEGKYIIELTTEDKNGEEINATKYFTLNSKISTKLAIPEICFSRLYKTTYNPGESAEVEIGTSENEEIFIYQLINKDKIIDEKIISLKNEKKIIQIPVAEDNHGGLSVNISSIKHNTFYAYKYNIYVPWTNKELEMSFESFRNKLKPGDNEEWKIKINDKYGQKVLAEMVATLFDASLETFRAHSFYQNLYPYFYSNISWSDNGSFTIINSNLFDGGWNHYFGGYYKTYDSLNYFGYYFNDFKSRGRYSLSKKASGAPSAKDDSFGEEKAAVAKSEVQADRTLNSLEDNKSPAAPVSPKQEENKKPDALGDVMVRTNLNETAFFYPNLETDKEGSLIISFKIPEALTRWKMLGFAHTKDMKFGNIENELLTQKEIMVVPNPPRFFRENDKIIFTSKVNNLTNEKLNCSVVLELFDSFTMKPVDKLFGNTSPVKKISINANQSNSSQWELNIPEGINALTFRVKAKALNFTDGEEQTIPVLTNRMLVTESLPLSINHKGTKEYKFEKLINNKSNTLTNERLTLEFTSNPAWYAIQSLPYIMEYPHECSEQLFSRFYANSISSNVVNSNPNIKKVFESWKNSKESLLSNLEKNEELKSMLLQETPWVLQAKDEAERKKRVGLLFDINRMSNELDSALNKLIKTQYSNGGWPWFPGLPDDRYITQHIVCGMGHLDRLGIKSINNDKRVKEMINKAVLYLDERMKEDYENLLKNNIDLKADNISYTEIHYLYARSFFPDIPVKYKKEFDYWKNQAKEFWINNGKYMQGLISLSLYRFGDKTTPQSIIKSLKENSIYNEELGMYWKENVYGYYWYEAPIETEALMIEAFNEITKDEESIGNMKIWLLKQKQTQDWKTTKATAEAIYALLLTGSKLLDNNEEVEIKIGNKNINELKEKINKEEGTGYFKVTWDKNEIKPELGNITLTKIQNSVSWGAMYWQYFENLDKITFQKTPLSIDKKLFIEKNTDKGPILEPFSEKNKMKVGDRIKVRIIIKTDRKMEYIHMKDSRASALEPVNVISQYKYQDGLWYYESTKDASTNFFIPWLDKGTYVFEYYLKATHKGDFSNGITTIQCMYAPEFTSHSEGIRIQVE